MITVGAGSQARPSYTLRWHDKPDYFVSWNDETLGSAGTSFAAARFVVWRLGISDRGVLVAKAEAGKGANPEVRKPRGRLDP
ncbi:MAG TPA: hypothetical protein VGC72_16825 [Candidatus Elarobacter sp.]